MIKMPTSSLGSVGDKTIKGKLIKRPSINIRKNIDYNVWSVNLDGFEHYYTEE
jgi:hypothetical protein